MSVPATNIPGATGLIPNQPAERVAPNNGDEGRLGAGLKIASADNGRPPPPPKMLRTDVKVGSDKQPDSDLSVLKGPNAHQRDANLPARLEIDSHRSDDTVHVRNASGFDRASFASGHDSVRLSERYSTNLLQVDESHRSLAGGIDDTADLAQLKEDHAELAAKLKTAHDKQADYINQRYEYNQKTRSDKAKENHGPIKSPLDLIKRVADGFSNAAKAVSSFVKDPAASFRPTPEPIKPPALPRLDDGTMVTVAYAVELEEQVAQLEDIISRREAELEEAKPVKMTHDDIIKELAAAPNYRDLSPEQQEQWDAEREEWDAKREAQRTVPPEDTRM